MSLGLTEHLTEMKEFLEGNDCWFVGLTTLPLLYADCLEIWEPQPHETLTASPGL